MTTCSLRRRMAVFALALAAMLGTWQLAAADNRVVPGRIIVKFNDALTANAADLLANGQPFASALTDGSNSLDQLNQEVGVTAASEVFFPHRGMSTSQAQAAFQQQLGAVKSRFPRRTARIAAGTPPPPDLTNIYTLTISAAVDPYLACAGYVANPHVAWCQPDYVLTTDAMPNDPYYRSSGSWGQPYADLWGLKSIRADRVWHATQGAGVVVAVVDSGVDATHPDIAANVIPGWDFVVGDGVPRDTCGHGTHVAGTIAAVGNNNIGIIGVAPRAQIMPMRAFDDTCSSSAATLATAVYFAAVLGAEVINNSWGCQGQCPSVPAWEEAVRTATGLGAVIVFAAGNNAADVFSYSPVNMTGPDKPIVVAANDRHLMPAVYPNNQGTNYGATVDISAPGGGELNPPWDRNGLTPPEPFRNILSLKAAQCNSGYVCPSSLIVGDSYLRQAGTSMATPHVSGLVALLLSLNPGLSQEDVRHLLQLSGHKRTPDSKRIGFGQIDAPVAVSSPLPPTARLSAPDRLQSFAPTGGPVAVRGTTTGRAWKLSFGVGTAPVTWKRIKSGANPVNDDLLAQWDISKLSAGVCTLQLLVFNGRRFVEEVQPIVVDQAVRLTTDDTHSYYSPTVGGNSVAAQVLPAAGGTSLGIALIDIGSGVESLIGTPGSDSPAFDPDNPDRLVYVRQSNGVPEIYLHSISSGTDLPITAVGSGDRGNPSIDGTHVVWRDWRDGAGNPPQLYAYDLDNQIEQRVTNNPVGAYSPHISGTTVVWQDGNAEPLPLGLQLYDFATGTPAVALAGDARAVAVCPNISGDWISWTQPRYLLGGYMGGLAIFAYNMSTTEVRELSSPLSLGQDGCTAINDGLVVWAQIVSQLGTAAILSYDLRRNTGPTQLSSPDLSLSGYDVAVSPQWVVWGATVSDASETFQQLFIRPRP